jgi:hypothetical protein
VVVVMVRATAVVGVSEDVIEHVHAVEARN